MSRGGTTAGLDAERSAVFEQERKRLLGLAYRLLGSVVDAEDVVQEAWLRFARTDLTTIERPAAWLTTVVSRLGLDRLRSRQRERSDYVGPWLPEPVASESMVGVSVASASAAIDPADQAELADSLTTAFLVLLEQLSPQERLAVLLADVFGESFRDVAGVLDKSEAATRQLTSRARKKLRDAAPDPDGRRPSPLAEQQAVAEQLVVAIGMGDLAGVTRLLAPDVVLKSDGGAKVHAARRPVVGADRVSRFVVNLATRFVPTDAAELGVANNRPALVMRRNGHPIFVVQFDVVDGQVQHLHVTVNPDKLAAFDHPIDLL